MFFFSGKEPDDYDHLSRPLIVLRLAPIFYICFNLAAKAGMQSA
jgi:hypothetical protein